jgi:hypothetical protein
MHKFEYNMHPCGALYIEFLHFDKQKCHMKRYDSKTQNWSVLDFIHHQKEKKNSQERKISRNTFGILTDFKW